MATLNNTIVDKLADLAKLSLTSAEKKKYLTELSAVLKHVEKLQELTIPAGEPQTHLHDFDHSPLRDDEPAPSLPVTKVLQNAGKRATGSYISTSKIL